MVGQADGDLLVATRYSTEVLPGPLQPLPVLQPPTRDLQDVGPTDLQEGLEVPSMGTDAAQVLVTCWQPPLGWLSGRALSRAGQGKVAWDLQETRTTHFAPKEGQAG